VYKRQRGLGDVYKRQAYDQVINCYADHLAATTAVDHSAAAYA
jgi:hypothetical protein